jgi:hypothetical protein
MALQEMVLALWLILKGFNSTALAATPGITTEHSPATAPPRR